MRSKVKIFHPPIRCFTCLNSYKSLSFFALSTFRGVICWSFINVKKRQYNSQIIQDFSYSDWVMNHEEPQYIDEDHWAVSVQTGVSKFWIGCQLQDQCQEVVSCEESFSYTVRYHIYTYTRTLKSRLDILS